MLDYEICRGCKYLAHRKYTKIYLCQRMIRARWYYTKKEFERDGEVPDNCNYKLEYTVLKQKRNSDEQMRILTL